MILDTKLIMAWEQAITSASAASAANTTTTPPAAGIIDLGLAARDVGVGTNKLYWCVLVTADMTDSGSNSTITPSLRTSATESASALTGSPATIITGQAFPALTKAGTLQINVLPPGAYLEYLDTYLTLAGGTLDTGKFSSWICTDVPQMSYYASGFNPN